MNPSAVWYMQRALALSLFLAPAAFVASPLTADDLYGAPDPGWYNQGSGYAPSAPSRGGAYGYDAGYGAYDAVRSYDYEPPSRGYSGGDYSSAAPRDQDWSSDRRSSEALPIDPYRKPYDGPRQETEFGEYREYRRFDVPPEYGAPELDRRNEDRFGDYGSASPYGDSGWTSGQEPGGDYWGEGRDVWDGRTEYDARVGRDESRGGRDAGGRSPWRMPPAQPKYRFRDDPELEQRYTGGANDGYRFRPMTERERDRQRSNAVGPRFVEPDRFRGRSEDREKDRGTAFGYEPRNRSGDDFYRRYYRSGP
jgi:hypothetical protein